jgi:hypothetical protein
MTFEEFAELSGDEQSSWLNGQLAEGKTPEDIYAILGSDKAGLGKIGIFYVPPKKSFMIKPMRGYQTTKFSGNEKADDAGIIGGSKID